MKARGHRAGGVRMKAATIGLALICACLFASGARAEDWKVTRLDGQASIFKDGDWSKLSSGDLVPSEAQVKTAADSSVTVSRGEESLRLAPKTQIQIQERKSPAKTVIRQNSGALGVDLPGGASRPVTIQTQFAAVEVKDAAIGMIAEPAASTILVRRGSVDVVDIAHGKTATLAAGRGAKVNPSHGAVVTPAADKSLAAANAALSSWLGAAPETAAATPVESKSFESAPVGPKSMAVADASALTKSIAAASAPARDAATLAKAASAASGASMGASSGSLAQDAAALGKVVAAPSSTGSGSLAQDAAALGASLKTDAPPMTDDQLRGMAEAAGKLTSGPRPEAVAVISAVSDGSWMPFRGRQVATPFASYVLALDGFDRFMFWGAIVPLYALLGFALNYVLQDTGFGVMRNALIAAASTFAGALIQEFAIPEYHLRAFEPGLSLAFLFGSIPVVLLASRFVANKL